MMIMKKLLALLVVISSLFCIFSCTQPAAPTVPEIPVSEGGVSFSEFVKATAATQAPKSAVVSTKRENEKGELNAVLNIAYNADGSFVIEYEKERYGSILNGEDDIVTETGTVSCDKLFGWR